jgi:hypothetical protein
MWSFGRGQVQHLRRLRRRAHARMRYLATRWLLHAIRVPIPCACCSAPRHQVVHRISPALRQDLAARSALRRVKTTATAAMVTRAAVAVISRGTRACSTAAYRAARAPLVRVCHRRSRGARSRCPVTIRFVVRPLRLRRHQLRPPQVTQDLTSPSRLTVALLATRVTPAQTLRLRMLLHLS